MTGENAGSALALGAFLDGIPEQAVLGIGIADRRRESASGCSSRSSSPTSPRRSAPPPRCAPRARDAATIRRLWLLVALICTAATVAGYAVADSVSGNLNAAVDGFAAGALLVMLIDSMIPEAVRKGGDISGLVTALGFAVAAALSGVS